MEPEHPSQLDTSTLQADAAQSLADLKSGAYVEGDGPDQSFIPKPDWLDEEKFKKGRHFVREYTFGMMFGYLLAILVGLTVDNLTNVLVFTGKTVGPDKARKRYVHTLKYIHDFSNETGDIFDSSSLAGKTILRVRHMHNYVRNQLKPKISAASTLEPMSQYDLALVQSGFVGPIILQTKSLGINTTEDQLEAFVYFWRVCGWCLGQTDYYNICTLGLKNAIKISQEIEDQMIIPGLLNPSEVFFQLSKDFCEGLFRVNPFINQKAVYALVFPEWGLQPPKLTVWENVCKNVWKGLSYLCFNFRSINSVMNSFFDWYIDAVAKYFG